MSTTPGSSDLSSARSSDFSSARSPRAPSRASSLRLLLGALVALGWSGCSSGYDLSIEVSDTTNASCNPDCVKSVWVEALAEFDGAVQCIDNVSMKSMRDHGLGGKVDLDIPDGLVGVLVVGHKEPGCNGPVMFDGVAGTESSDVKVPLRCIASCAVNANVDIQATSLLAVARGQCALGGATTASAGTLRNLGLDRFFPDYRRAEFAGAAPVPMTNGLATMEAAKQASVPGACSAVMLYKDGAPVSTTCIRYGEPGVCGAAGKTEVGYYEAPAQVDLTGGYRVVGVVARRGATAGTTVPISGAVISLPASAPMGSRVEYLALDPGATAFRVVPAATTTDASGSFAVYLREPTQVTVTQGGTTMMRLLGGGTLFGDAGEIVVSGAQVLTVP